MERALGRLARRSILSRLRRPGLSSSVRPCYELRSSLKLTVSYLHSQAADPPTHFRVRSFEDVGFQKFLRRGLASAAGGPGEIVVPPFAESVTEGTIASVTKQPGDAVQVDEVIALIETDKVTIDLRATESGTLKELKIKAGDVVKPGQVVGTVAVGDTSGKEAAPKPSEKVEEKKAADKPAASPSPPSTPPPPPPPPQPSSPASKPAAATSSEYVLPPKDRERRVPMTRLRKRVAARLKDSQNTFAMLTTFNEVDMTNLMELRSKYKDDFQQKHGAKLGFMSAFVKATVSALQHQPVVNGVIDGDDIVYRDYIDISIAVGTPKGLVVPVLRAADKLSFAEVETTIAMLGKKANEGKISIDDMAGGTFTISNGGVYGSLLSTPIINPPQSAILGMHSIQKRPMVVGNAIVARPMMYIALTYDHRLIDGREAVLFLRRIKDVIEDPSRLLLDV